MPRARLRRHNGGGHRQTCALPCAKTAIEHAGGMLAVVVLVRMGRVMAMNARSGSVARNRRFACFALATAVMLMTIPWPGLAHGRPLFRLIDRDLSFLRNRTPITVPIGNSIGVEPPKTPARSW